MGRRKRQLPSEHAAAVAQVPLDVNNQEEEEEDGPNVLWWHSAAPHVPLAAEEDMVKVILRWGKKERGMLRNQPPFRLREIRAQCQCTGMQIAQVCSLRRHHMSFLNPYKSKEALGLGKLGDIRAAADLFENVIASFLRRKDILYYSEEEQKEQFRQSNPGELLRGTPDFKMKEAVQLKVYSVSKQNGNRQRIQSERTIYWLEAKMFFGASTM